MTSTFLHFRVIQKRMLDRKEAAEHCGRTLKQFERECPVVATVFPNGDLRYDVHELDAWLDGLKVSNEDDVSILRRLAGNDGRAREGF